jgi:hypothetical protein
VTNTIAKSFRWIDSWRNTLLNLLAIAVTRSSAQQVGDLGPTVR